MNHEDFPRMVKKLFKSGSKTIPDLNEFNIELVHAAIGLTGEALELLEFGERYSSNHREEAKEYWKNFKEELGDTEFYLEKIKQLLGFSADYICTSFDGRSSDYFFDADKIHFVRIRTAIKEICIYSGEILDSAKKTFIYNKELQRERIVLAVKNICSLLAYLYHITFIEREDILRENMEKLIGEKGRYSGGEYSDQAAQDRADKNIPQ